MWLSRAIGSRNVATLFLMNCPSFQKICVDKRVQLRDSSPLRPGLSLTRRTSSSESPEAAVNRGLEALVGLTVMVLYRIMAGKGARKENPSPSGVILAPMTTRVEAPIDAN